MTGLVPVIHAVLPSLAQAMRGKLVGCNAVWHCTTPPKNAAVIANDRIGPAIAPRDIPLE